MAPKVIFNHIGLERKPWRPEAQRLVNAIEDFIRSVNRSTTPAEDRERLVEEVRRVLDTVADWPPGDD